MSTSDPTALVACAGLDCRSGEWQVRLPGEPVIGCQTLAQAEQIACQRAQRDRRPSELVVLDAYARVIEQRPLTPTAEASTRTARRPPRARPATTQRRGQATGSRAVSPSARTAARNAPGPESPCP